LDVMCI